MESYVSEGVIAKANTLSALSGRIGVAALMLKLALSISLY